jgi:hypothetical protein
MMDDDADDQGMNSEGGDGEVDQDELGENGLEPGEVVGADVIRQRQGITSVKSEGTDISMGLGLFGGDQEIGMGMGMSLFGQVSGLSWFFFCVT